MNREEYLEERRHITECAAKGFYYESDGAEVVKLLEIAYEDAYKEGFVDALKTLPIEQVAERTFKIRELLIWDYF